MVDLFLEAILLVLLHPPEVDCSPKREGSRHGQDNLDNEGCQGNERQEIDGHNPSADDCYH